MASNKVYLFIGERNTGKTTACYKVASAGTKKIIVLDDIVHPAYIEFDRINEADINKTQLPNSVINFVDIDTVLSKIGYYQANKFLIIEDSSRFINATLSNAVKTFVINHRKMNFDIAFMFHSLREVPPYLAMNYNRMVLFKTGENMDIRQPKWLNWDEIKVKHNKVMKSKKNNDCIVIDKG